ncbi:TRAP transporter large permease [Desulfitibacter alkalitolerans]|uniref:TRAP transporter large permease n=1 Tax=Desulfitibacter alkalitolerans TaxID=264641 RepID=UPI00048028BC|nr:TRAP transporter large permease [Desulfitibacter alkalitolerans]
MISAILFGGLLFFLLLSVPIAFSLGLASVFTIWILKPMSMEAFGQATIQALNSFPLMAVPLFTFAGTIMAVGGVSKRLLNFSELVLGKLTGGLGIVSIAACLFFSSISGTGSATVAAIGVIMIPAMVAHRYSRPFATSLIAASGGMGALIPPSVIQIVYAVTAGVSVIAMFAAAIGPGLLVAIVFAIYTFIYSKKHGYTGVVRKYSAREALKISLEAILPLSIPVVVLGGIYKGIFTPTEAAAVASLYGIILSVFVYKEVKVSKLPFVAFNAVLICAPVLAIIGVSTGFGHILTIAQVPQKISAAILDITTSKILILLMINVLLLIVGTFMETNAAIILLTPILLPIVIELGINPVHFGAIMIVNLVTGFITPPVGCDLFMASQISGLKFDLLVKAIVPWIILMIVVIVLVTYIPAISLTLPKLMNLRF